MNLLVYSRTGILVCHINQGEEYGKKPNGFPVKSSLIANHFFFISMIQHFYTHKIFSYGLSIASVTDHSISKPAKRVEQ